MTNNLSGEGEKKLKDITKKYGVTFDEDEDMKVSDFLEKKGYKSMAELIRMTHPTPETKGEIKPTSDYQEVDIRFKKKYENSELWQEEYIKKSILSFLHSELDRVREEVIDKLEPFLNPLYKSGSFDVFNLKVAIKKELSHQIELAREEGFVAGVKVDDDQRIRILADIKIKEALPTPTSKK